MPPASFRAEMCVVVIVQARIGERNYDLAVLHRDDDGVNNE